MPTARLVPSAYTVSNSSYVNVTNAARMYDNTDDTSDYASIRGRNSNVFSYYCYLRGFNFSQVPSDATVSLIRVKVRCYRNSYQRVGDSNNLCLASGTSTSAVITDTRTTEEIGTSASVITIPTGSLDWDTMRRYGSSLSIQFRLSSTSNATPIIYVYGAEIEVTYSLPVPVITVGTPSRTIISDESGYDQATCTFRSDLALQAWEARATKAGTTPARGVGLLVESGTTLAANTDATVVVDDEELTSGDGEYTITVYGQSTGGEWSG